MAVNASKQPRKRLYHLKRSETEVNVNDYNAALLMANQSNVDVQFIGHLGSRLPYYICDYMTKNENSEQDDMWHDIYSSTKSLGSNAMSFLLKSVKVVRLLPMTLQIGCLATNYSASRDRCDSPTFSQLTKSNTF